MNALKNENFPRYNAIVNCQKVIRTRKERNTRREGKNTGQEFDVTSSKCDKGIQVNDFCRKCLSLKLLLFDKSTQADLVDVDEYVHNRSQNQMCELSHNAAANVFTSQKSNEIHVCEDNYVMNSTHCNDELSLYCNSSEHKSTNTTNSLCVYSNRSNDRQCNVDEISSLENTGTNIVFNECPTDITEETSFKERCVQMLTNMALITTLVDVLFKYGCLEDFIKLVEHLAEGSLACTNIAFLLCLDRAKLQSCISTTTMHFCKETKQFWEVVYRICKGKALHLFSGSKHRGFLQSHECICGNYDPKTCNVNFAVSNEKILLKSVFDMYTCAIKMWQNFQIIEIP